MKRYCLVPLLIATLLLGLGRLDAGDDKTPGDVAGQLRELNPRIFPADGDKAKELSQMLEKDSRPACKRPHSARTRPGKR